MFDNVDALIRNFDRTLPLINTMLQGPAPLNSLEFHGTAEDLEKIQRAVGPKLKDPNVRIDYYDSGTGYQTGSSDRSGMEDIDRGKICSMYPYFTINNWASCEPILNEIASKSSSETGCYHFAWTRSDDQLRWHGYFIDGEALKKHLDAVRPLIDQLNAGPARIDRLEVHGPQSEIEKGTTPLQGIPETHYFASDQRVRRLPELIEPSLALRPPRLL
mmetsp:Transcript_11800/g.27637  ORF Transcript_11800/g.27637 Transcript_11800/m.27637 type:complete len:217 (+) Transcript_11800:91-741(+)